MAYRKEFLALAGAVIAAFAASSAEAVHSPVANIGGSYTFYLNSGLTLNASASYSPDGDPITFAWDLNNDGQFLDAPAAAIINLPAHFFATAEVGSVFPIAMRVTDNVSGLYATAYTTLIVIPGGPTSVPEPASWAIFIAGFGMVGGALRGYRKRAVAFG